MGHEYIKESETFNTSRNGTVPKPTASDISNNKVLGASGNWVAQSGGGGGGSSNLAGLNDVDTTGVGDGDLLGYDSNSSKWIPKIPSNGHTYSTTEQVVGTWIDGKPVYEKVLQFTNMTVIHTESDSNTNIDLSSLNINVMVDFYGWYKRQWGTSSGQNRIAKFGYYEKSGSNMAIHSNLRWNNDSKRLEYCNVVPSSQTVPEATIIIRYTKTTDS